MLLKEGDCREEDLESLKTLLLVKGLSPKQKFLIEREIRNIQKGLKGEKDASYYINFYYANSKNWVVIHDLRIEYQGQVAQIDHILINRMFHLYVLESKNFGFAELKINKLGEFEVKYGKKYFGIPSPIEQNQRHIDLLSKVIREMELVPTILGLSRMPIFFNYVLVSPQTKIIRPKGKKDLNEKIIKADMLKKVIEENPDRLQVFEMFKSLCNLCSLETIIEFGHRLVSLHKPKKPNWSERFGIKESQINGASSKYYCFRCGRSIPEKVAKFCWKNKHRFKGKAYCYDCQRLLKARS